MRCERRIVQHPQQAAPAAARHAYLRLAVVCESEECGSVLRKELAVAKPQHLEQRHTHISEVVILHALDDDTSLLAHHLRVANPQQCDGLFLGWLPGSASSCSIKFSARVRLRSSCSSRAEGARRGFERFII